MIFRRNRQWLSIAIIIGLGILTYANSLHVPFIFDDFTGILENPKTTQLNVEPHLKGNILRFLPYYSFAVNYRIGGWDVFGFHIVNVAIHIANALLIFFLLQLMLKTNVPNGDKNSARKIVPFTAAILFLVHPIQTQAVTYISQRLTLMAAFFYLATMVFYLQAIRQKLRLVPYFAALVSMGCALISKEIAITLPVSLLLLTLFSPSRRSWKNKAILILPFFSILLIIRIISMKMTDSNFLAVFSLPATTTSLSRSEYLLTQVNVVSTYLGLLILPIKQNLDYDYPIARSILEPQTAASFMLLSLILFYGLSKIKSNRLAAFGILFFFIALSVESTFIPITDVIAEHRVYLPSVGFFILVAAGSNYVFHKLTTLSRRRIAVMIFFSIVALLTFATIRRNAVWSNEFSLWSDVVEKSANKVRPRIALGMSLANRNQLQEAVGELQTADKLNQKTVSISRDAYTIAIHTYLASVYERLNDWENARKQYESLFIFFPNDATIMEKTAIMYLKSGNSEKGGALLKKAAELNPQSATVHYNLGNFYFSEGKIVTAIEEFQNALKLNPNLEEAKRNLQIIREKYR